MKYLIKHDREACIGCGACVAVCPDNWKMNGDKPDPVKTEVDEIGCTKQAAEQCPVDAIKIEEKNE